MSKAYVGRHRRKKTIWQIMGVITLVMVVLAVILVLVSVASKVQLLDFFVQGLLSDSKLLFLLIFNVFVVGGALLVMIVQWAEHENERFRMKQRAYRSMLVCKDYYRSIRRIKVDQTMMQLPDGQARKLDIDHNLKDSSLVTLGGVTIARQARQTNIAFNKEGYLSGIFKTYFSNGNLLAEVSYKNGMLDGRCVIYYVNGFLHNEKFFKEGRLHGIFRAWDESGALFFEINYENDVQHGSDKSYRKNGVLESEDIYEHGRLVQRKTYDETGHFKYAQGYKQDRSDL